MFRISKAKYVAFPTAVGLSIVLTACGGSTKAATSSSTTGISANGSGSTAPPTAGHGPAAAGQVASVSGSSMEVQSETDGQETVIWTSSTTFDATKEVTASALTAGDCATVSGTTSNGVISARTIAITGPSSSGTCTVGGFGIGGPGGFGGQRPPSSSSGSTGSTPNGPAPGASAPSGSAPTGFGDISIAIGKVTAVSGDTLTISGYSLTGRSSKRGSSPSTTVPGTKTIKVTLASSTTYTERSKGSSSDLAVGKCVSADGSTASTGTVTATSVSITPAIDGTCSTGTGFARGGPAAGDGTTEFSSSGASS